MDSDQEQTWLRALLRFRKEKDEYFGMDLDSPIPAPERENFHGLVYFEPDPALRFEVALQRHPESESVIMTTSKGTRQLFNKVGHFDLLLDGQEVRLIAYQSAERNDSHLFIPFRDGTSGEESYAASRYMDLRVEHDDRYAVDFNYAYNPYCAYNDGYVCPLPPQENWLTAPVRAGEKKFHD